MKSFQHLSFQKGLLFVAFFLGICQVSLAQTIAGSNTTIEPNTATTFTVTGIPNTWSNVTYNWYVTGIGTTNNSTTSSITCTWDCNLTN